ncbi:hypothetical protein GTQ38_15500 [Flavobacteriaceae bacterium R33]|uniref:Uncharacterized protein n=2 Tax=Poritiphilus flavus TaxID=2697053 RepID=A0A6L9EFY0_9FLAO|nr:hypothetical protein [Poritiphilus flavus]
MLWFSCRKDFEYAPNIGRLEFSKDTVFLDTVFTNIGSSTYSLKVYNRTGNDILIPSVGLGQGTASNYRLNVDGEAGKTFTDVPILARDSLFIFIETTFDVSSENQNEFLYTDAIVFDSGVNEQQVPLVTLIKDAVFLFPGTLSNGSKESLLLGIDEQGNEIRIEGFLLEDEELLFTNEKPYVIYGYAAIGDGKTLVVNAGARVHFHENSGLLVGSGGSLQVNGSLSADQELLENEVIFEGDRLEPDFANISGQWGTIWLAPGSAANTVNYLTIKNATVGMLVEGGMGNPQPTLSISNSQIHNSATTNLWARTSVIEGSNLVLGNAGNASLSCSLGGDYVFIHSTIANYWSNGFRIGAALQLSNTENVSGGGTLDEDLTRAEFLNCIIDGNTSLELALQANGNNTFNFSFLNCMLQFRDTGEQFTGNPLYDFTDNSLYSGLILNAEAEFLSTAKNDFRIGENSAAIGAGDPQGSLAVPLDLLGVDRPSPPDLGAFQYVPDN